MKNHLVAVLAHPPVSLFELSCAVEIFGRTRPDLGVDWYDFAIVAEKPGPIASLGGIDLQIREGLELFERAHTIIIPAWDAGDPSPELVATLRAARKRGARLLSICSGAFALAATGLLDGRRAATHWLYAAELQRRYPDVIVDADVLYVDDGDIITAAGSAAGLDMLLHLVRRDHGAQICNLIARRLNIPPHREGGQSQFALRPVPEIRSSKLADVIDWMRVNSARELTIEELAGRAAMSPRTFFRRFRETTGLAPYEWLTLERTAIARDLLETGGMTVDDIAFRAGFSSAETMRLHFKRIIGCAPADYRKHFGARDEPPEAIAAE